MFGGVEGVDVMSGFRCGFIGIVGPPNSGKSTLVNALVHEKVSIVSFHSHTTYHLIRGIKTTEKAQYIFVDTPGIDRTSKALLKKHRKLSPHLSRIASSGVQASDVVLWVFDVTDPECVLTIREFSGRKNLLIQGKDHFCLLNKIDLFKDKASLLPMLQEISQMGMFSSVIPISARKNDGIEAILDAVTPLLPEGPALFDPTEKTDRTLSFRLREQVRESVYFYTRQEIPYSVFIETEGLQSAQKTPTMDATIYVDSASRKAMLIGKRGEMVKKIGVRARAEIEKILKQKICLRLHVSVHENWMKDERLVGSYLEVDTLP